jgi:hypothetical protein
MTWIWTKLDGRPDDSRVVHQFREYGCGAACAVMLLADRGIPADQLVVATRLHLPCTAHELADCLNHYSNPDFRWFGGYLDADPPPEPSLLQRLGRFGSRAALLIPGASRTGHWVVVDAVLGVESIRVRDPAGSSYSIPLDEFQHLIRFMAVVFEAKEAV